MKLPKAIVAVLFIANCIVAVWFHCLPDDSQTSRYLLNEANNAGAEKLVIEVGRAYQKKFEQYAIATRVGVGVIVMDLLFFLFVAVYLYRLENNSKKTEQSCVADGKPSPAMPKEDDS